MIIVKKVRILLLSLIIIQLTLIIFRWEKGPEQQDGNLKIVHKRDRWTDTNWIEAYGQTQHKLYSGEERPIFSEQEIAEQSSHVANQKEFVERREIDRQREIEWNENQEKVRKDFETSIETIETIINEYYHSISNPIEKDYFSIKANSALHFYNICSEDAVQYEIKDLVDKKIDSESLEAYETYCKNRFTFDYDQDTSIDKDIEAQALQILNKAAWQKREQLTKSTYMILTILFLFLIVSALFKKRKT
ncbi:hypothetical protein V7112_22965 [Bacillus sp. JJ1566]|uniref:hypothetical protein n=1 Tax=Bacillus sp. JJ1566 TaxID=3122961 RepID=UPI002FFE0CBB